MSDKLFPDEKREYKYEEKESKATGERLKDLLERIKRYLPSLDLDWNSEKDVEESLGESSYSDPTSTGFEIEREEKDRSFTEKAGLPTYVILSIEFILVTYLVLALLGFVPMF